MKHLNRLLPVVLLTVSVQANAAFLDPRSIEIASTLAPPPRPGSIEDMADFEQILKFQKTRTKAECVRAAYEVKVNLETFFGERYGSLSQSEVARLAEFFEQIRLETDIIVQKSKVLYQRPRPYMANSSVHPCVHKEVTNAYPSGHAAISRVFALALSELAPSQGAVYLKRADQIGLDRILSGMHHPTDIRSGQELGDKIFAAFKRSANFQATVKKFQNIESR